MKFNLKKELPILSIIAIPFLYLGYLWNSLPEKVPIHWNINGEIDGWGTKDQLILIVLALPVLMYGIFLLVPLIDPKKKFEKMGNKLYQLKFLMILFMSVLAVYILYTAQHQSSSNMKMLYVLIGFLLVALGNYCQALKPNYFIGIKTPWTLESETVWKETHKLGGKLWFFGGILMILAILLLPVETSFIVFITAVSVFVIVPIVYSYRKFKALEN